MVAGVTAERNFHDLSSIKGKRLIFVSLFTVSDGNGMSIQFSNAPT